MNYTNLMRTTLSVLGVSLFSFYLVGCSESTDKAEVKSTASDVSKVSTEQTESQASQQSKKLSENNPKVVVTEEVFPEPPASKKAVDLTKGQHQLWQLLDTDIENKETYAIQADPAVLSSFAIDGVVTMQVTPDHSVSAKLVETYNGDMGEMVWKGEIVDGDNTESMLVTEGERTTIISLATRYGNQTIVVDKKTGKGRATSEDEIAQRQNPKHVDAIPVKDDLLKPQPK
ncbi:hypothetical protein KCM76_09690 [Zooshikella marina]|uniref:hypothetical protein n=1 Tax=Zooshikella ganghwensis TaxID=202772 RepID=UPI001BAFFFFB|nr:hypothetical protein [Zooshikella ganghwensis]MBU2706259.1 hypothetical protein [Zooshikella ganghwensis]